VRGASCKRCVEIECVVGGEELGRSGVSHGTSRVALVRRQVDG
jgi:hypothetical protein